MHKFLLYLLLVYSYSFSKTIEYKEALILTIQNNKDLKAQELNIESSKLDIKKVNSFSYGKIDLVHEFSNTNHSGYVFNSKLSSREASFNDFGFSQMAEGIDTQPKNLNNPSNRNNFTTKITYDIPLFTGFKLSNQEDILKLQHKAQTIKLSLDKKLISFELLKAYNAAVVAKEFIKATSKAKEATSFFVKSANEFYKEGLVTKIDKKQARVYELNIQSKIIDANNKFDLSIAYLKFLTSDFDIKDVKELKIFKYKKSNLDQLYKYALKYRDDLKMLEQNKIGMKKNINISESSYFPSVYSHLEYGLNDDTLTLDSNKDYYLASLGIKYTLFDNSRKYSIQKSKIEFNKTSLNFNKLKDAIKLQIEKAYLNINSKEKIYKEKKEAKELAYEVLEQSKLMYKNQLISMTELLKQEAIFRENEASLIMAKYDKSISQANLYITIGKNLK